MQRDLFDQMFSSGESKLLKTGVSRQHSLHLQAVTNRMCVRMNSLPNIKVNCNGDQRKMRRRPAVTVNQLASQSDLPRVASIVTSRRKSSLPGSFEEMEITRRFVATRTKVINKGDMRTEMEDSLESSLFINPRPGGKMREYSVVFLGSSSVGKSSIIRQFLRTEHDDVFRREFVRLPGDNRDRVVLVDVNGSVSKLSIAECEELEGGNIPDCLVLVYSIDDHKSFDFVISQLTSALVRYENFKSGAAGVILVGNKTDLARTRQVQSKEGRDLAVLYGLKFIETGAGIGHNIDQLLVGIVIQSRLQNKHQDLNENILKEKLKGFFDSQKRKLSTKKKKVMNLNI